MAGILGYFRSKMHNYFNPKPSFGYIDFGPIMSQEGEKYIFQLRGQMEYKKFFTDIINNGEIDYTLFNKSVKSNIYFKQIIGKIASLPNNYFYISLDPVLFSISHVSNTDVDSETVSPDIFTKIANIIEDPEETFWKKNHEEDDDEEDEEDEEEDDEDEDEEVDEEVDEEHSETKICPCCGHNPTLEVLHTN